jgi:hypothetical protein
MDTTSNHTTNDEQRNGAERLHTSAHRHLNRFCVHCGHKGRKPECDGCLRQFRARQHVDPETGYFITKDGDEIGLMFDPYLRCME